jgi:uncharacterized damage-inducible protein DinB
MMTSEDRRQPPADGSEVDTLRGFLDFHRDTLRWKCAGLGEEELRRTMPPTDMTLAGLVLHLTMVESGWFNLTFAGGVALPGWLSIADVGDPDWSWRHAHEFGADQLWQWYDEAIAVSDRVISDALATEQGLATRAVDPEEPVTLRWLLGHMIEEYARHNGHADLLRQAIDGAVGE